MAEHPVMAIGEWKNNAEMIAAVATLGYLNGRVLDCTYGKGNFWTVFQPEELVGCDINPAKSPIGYPVDFTTMAFANGVFDSVVIDPPYKLNGSPTGRSDHAYGVDVAASREGRLGLARAGVTECVRCLRDGGYLLIKVQDQVNGGRVRWQTRDMTEHAEKEGCDLVDSFLFRSYRPQPTRTRKHEGCRGAGCAGCSEGRIASAQQHAARNYSTLLVLEKR